jgi:shikimate dehydrogenase
MQRAGVLGKPVGHSLSPVIHRAGYAAAGLAGWSYTAIECAEAELADLVSRLDPEWAGLSLTMPLKQEGLRVADEVAPLPATLGAANTLVRLSDGRWRAENTDAGGIAGALAAALAGGSAAPAPGGSTREPAGSWVAAGGSFGVIGRLLAGAQVVVLGAGGTARAALGGAAQLAATSVTVVARRPEAVAALVPVAETLGVELVHQPWPAAVSTIAAADVVISTVPKGVADPIAGQVGWRPSTVLLDAIYHPWPTPLAAAAAAAGATVVSGLELLLAQAAGQFQLFTGVPAPLAAMRTALATAPGAG